MYHPEQSTVIPPLTKLPLWEFSSPIMCYHDRTLIWSNNYALEDSALWVIKGLLNKVDPGIYRAPSPEHYPFWSKYYNCWVWRKDNIILYSFVNSIKRHDNMLVSTFEMQPTFTEAEWCKCGDSLVPWHPLHPKRRWALWVENIMGRIWEAPNPTVTPQYMNTKGLFLPHRLRMMPAKQWFWVETV